MHHEKLRVLVVGGGPSSEHEVSLHTAQNVFDNLRPDRYEATLATITKDGTWLIPSFLPMEMHEAMPLLRDITDVVFIALHGEFGENGQLQSLFDRYHVLYTGSGAEASRLGMHKIIARDRFRAAGIAVPPAMNFAYGVYERAHREILGAIASKFVFPVVVKPVDRGSSVGVSIAHALPYVEEGIHNVFHYSPHAMAEQFVPGTELSCGVLELHGGKLQSLIPTEIVPKKESFFGYDSKYSPDGSEEITPARVPKSVLRKAQDIAVTAHRMLGCRGYSRTDMIWDKQKDMLNILEINTLPGFTNTSIFPQQALVAGFRFSDVLDTIIASAFRK